MTWLLIFVSNKKIMLQRIQTIYLLIAIVALTVATLGVSIFEFSYTTELYGDGHAKFNSYGIQKESNINYEKLSPIEQNVFAEIHGTDALKSDSKMASSTTIPLYIGSAILIVLCLITLFSFKKLKSQIKFGRLTFFLTFIMLVVTLIFYYVGGNFFYEQLNENNMEAATSKTLGIGFYCLIAAVAFLFLANIGIRRDLKLIESVDRIR